MEAAVYATQLYVNAWYEAVKSAIESGHIGDGMCNEFVLAVGQVMHIYFPQAQHHYYVANDIYDFFNSFSQSHPSGWRRISKEDVLKSQEDSSNLDGLFIVGAAHSIEDSGNKHGHVVLATPSGFPRAHHRGEGPWAIDAKRAKKMQCFHASRLFYTVPPNQLTKVIWAIYQP